MKKANFRKDLLEEGQTPHYIPKRIKIPDKAWDEKYDYSLPDIYDDKEFNVFLKTPYGTILVRSIDFEFVNED